MGYDDPPVLEVPINLITKVSKWHVLRYRVGNHIHIHCESNEQFAWRRHAVEGATLRLKTVLCDGQAPQVVSRLVALKEAQEG